MSQPPSIPPEMPEVPPDPARPTPPIPPHPGVPPVPRASSMGSGTKALLFGCLGLVLIAVVAGVIGLVWVGKKTKEIAANPEQFAAELILKQYPDFEFVRVDKERRQMIVREKKTGEETVVSMEDLKNGKITLRKSDGTTAEVGEEGIRVRNKHGNQTAVGGTVLASLPNWVPVYPGDHTVVMSSRQDKGTRQAGTTSFTTPEPTATAANKYQELLGQKNFIVEVQETSAAGVEVIVLNATAPDGQTSGATVKAQFMSQGEGTVGNIEISSGLPEP